MTVRIWVLAASINGLLSVAGGAAAGHLFAADAHRIALMSTGAQYAMYHALALLALAALAGASEREADRLLAIAAWLFIAGTVLFSGSLYLLALTGISALAWLTPLGGTAFLFGWAALAAHAWRRRGRLF